MSLGAFEIGHDLIQGRVCPRITFWFAEEGGLKADTRQYVYRGFRGGMTLTMVGCNLQLLSWTYDHIKKDWRAPVYATQPDLPGQDEYIRGLVGRLLERVHEILDSDEAITYFAAQLPPEEDLAKTDDQPDARSPFAKVLGALSSHFKAEEQSLSSTDYLLRRRRSLVGRVPPAPSSAPRSSVPFKPDLSDLPR